MLPPDAVRDLDEEALSDWILQQRWFGSKARDVAEINVLEHMALHDDPPLGLALVEARFAAGTHELYQLLPGASQKGIEFDALADPGRGAVLGALLAREAVVEGSAGIVSFHHVQGAAVPGGEPRLMGAEQSNSSIVFGDELVLKVFRRLEPGDNPELEMLRFLTERGFDGIAALAGWYDFSGERMDATLGVLQAFVGGARDGWELALADPEGLLARLGALGEATGRMHTALGSDATDPAFAPEEPSAESLSLLTATIDEDIERVFLDLPDDEPALEPIAHRGEEVRDRLQLMSHVGVGGRLIRHHGDFHLGQTLVADDGQWVILDFEGEPARSLIERRRKRSPLRDVAGMLRSFAYAASSAQMPPDWEARAREAFVGGYLAAIEPSLLPAGQVAIEKLLSIFELEKAVYELRYELNNRPDWVPIPVAGIARLLEGPIEP